MKDKNGIEIKVGDKLKYFIDFCGTKEEITLVVVKLDGKLIATLHDADIPVDLPDIVWDKTEIIS